MTTVEAVGLPGHDQVGRDQQTAIGREIDEQFAEIRFVIDNQNAGLAVVLWRNRRRAIRERFGQGGAFRVA